MSETPTGKYGKTIDALKATAIASADASLPLLEAEALFRKFYVEHVLEKTRTIGGRLHLLRAARVLGIHRNTLTRVMRDSHLEPDIYLPARCRP